VTRLRSALAATLNVTVTAALAACASGASSQASELAGCYQLERNAGARALGLPWGFVLEDEELGAGWPLVSERAGVQRARTATSPTGRADVPFGYWASAAGDSVEIGYPGGGGVVLTLASTGQDLIGQGVAVGDAVPLGGAMGPRAPVAVTARRVLCGAS
jgi:hypothetical protein